MVTSVNSTRTRGSVRSAQVSRAVRASRLVARTLHRRAALDVAPVSRGTGASARRYDDARETRRTPRSAGRPGIDGRAPRPETVASAAWAVRDRATLRAPTRRRRRSLEVDSSTGADLPLWWRLHLMEAERELKVMKAVVINPI